MLNLCDGFDIKLEPYLRRQDINLLMPNVNYS